MEDDFDDTQKIEGDTRTYYPNRPLAQTAANRGQEEYADRGVHTAFAQFEPDKGFVAVLVTDQNIPEAWEAGFEVQLPHRSEKTPTDWSSKKKAPPTSGAKPSTAPTSGTTARVHAIAQALVNEGKVGGRADRAKVMVACEEAGINKATAGTQWAKFAKMKGW